MPLISVRVTEGRLSEPEQKRKIVAGISKVMEEVGIPSDKLHILFEVYPLENWGRAGKLLSDK